MTVLTPTGERASVGTGGDRGAVLAVLPLHDVDVAVLRYAALVAAVDGRPLRVLVLRPRSGFSTDAALVAARRRLRRRVHALATGYGGGLLEVDALDVSRRTLRDPQALGAAVAGAARARQVATVVVPESLGLAAPVTVPGASVVTVHSRPGGR